MNKNIMILITDIFDQGEKLINEFKNDNPKPLRISFVGEEVDLASFTKNHGAVMMQVNKYIYMLKRIMLMLRKI